MKHNRAFNPAVGRRRYQTGAATLIMALIMLVGLTIVTFYAADMGLMRQRIASNEMRAREAFEAAEKGVNTAEGWLKANKKLIASSGTGGWVASGNQLWVLCNPSATSPSRLNDLIPCGDGSSRFPV